jgi:hypothetical protein
MRLTQTMSPRCDIVYVDRALEQPPRYAMLIATSTLPRVAFE